MGLFYKISLRFASLSLALPALVSLISPASATESYSATVEDGTAKIIRSNTVIEDNAEYLASPTLPTKVAPKPAPTPTPPADESSEENDNESETAANENTPANTAPVTATSAAKVSAKPKPEKTVFEHRLNEMVQIRGKEVIATPLIVAPSKPISFDAVPSDRVAELSERITIASDILSRFGRAYDYRTITLSDFKRIVTELETEKSRNKN